MNDILLVRIIFSLFIALTFALSLCYKTNLSENKEQSPYLLDLSGLALPLFLFLILILGSITEGVEVTSQFILSICFTVFLHISIYYLFLIAILPFLRRHISARACYMLWLVPNYLYFAFQKVMQVDKPLLVIRAPGNLVWILFQIWLLGFIVFFTWKIISHLVFRHNILKDARPIRNLTILRCWAREMERSRLKYKDYGLFCSSKVTTPLSIGLFKRTICIILPDLEYSEEELSLIFRHELVHIAREDSWMKFFLIFCASVCWFNPLMWIALKKSAEDIELTCDEFVLKNEPEEVKTKYASLILQTAGNEQGFTTCLSASAKTLRYRLQNIMSSKKQHSGAVIVGIISFLLFMSCGYVSLAYGTYTISDFYTENLETYSVHDISEKNNATSSYTIHHNSLDSSALFQYLNNLTFSRATGNYAYSEDDKTYFIALEDPEGTIEWFELTTNRIQITSRNNNQVKGSKYVTNTYYLTEPTDWEYLDSILLEHPVLEIEIQDDYDHSTHHITGSLDKLYLEDGNQQNIVYASELDIKDMNGIYGLRTEGFPYGEFTFSKKPIEPYSISIESWDGKHTMELSSKDFIENDRMQLVDYPAWYRIRMKYQENDGAIYTAEFCFNIGEFGNN